MAECPNTFDQKHHYRPRKFGAVTQRTVLGCACGRECPRDEVDAVKAALRAGDEEIARQREAARRFTEKSAPAEQARLL